MSPPTTTWPISSVAARKLAAAQGWVCAICGCAIGRGVANWATDHDHISLLVRGILCTSCNVGLGMFRDSIISLERAHSYLLRAQWRARAIPQDHEAHDKKVINQLPWNC